MDSTLLETMLYDFQSLWTVKLSIIATTAFLVFEYLITIDEEVELIWKSNFNMGKFLYLLNRYLPFLSSTMCFYVWIMASDSSTCRPIVVLAASLDNVQFVIVNFSIYTRVNAVWSKNKSVLSLLATTLAISVICSSYVTARFISGIESVNMRFFPHGCTIQITNNLVWINFINVMSWEALALALVFIKRFYDHNTKGSHLYSVIVEDGLIYFAAIQALTITDIVLLNTLPLDLSSICVPIQAALQSALCARLFIHLRSEAHKERICREHAATPSRSMDFAERSTHSSRNTSHF